MNIQKLVQEIESHLTQIHSDGYGATMYINCIDCDGDMIKIRVSDHSCNDRNNNGKRCLSFISKSHQRTSGQWQNVTEWVINSDMETKEYETIEDILSDYCIISYKYLGQTVKIS